MDAISEKSPAEFFAENKNFAGFDNCIELIGLTEHERVDATLYDDFEIEKTHEIVNLAMGTNLSIHLKLYWIFISRVPRQCQLQFHQSYKKPLAKETLAQELQAKNASLGKQVKDTPASKGIKGLGEDSFYRVTCKDNGKGMPHDDIPNMFGRVLSGTKYGMKQTRGKFGLGAKMVLIWSKVSTGLPIEN
ncbi:DNA topoisomerase 6 subunit b-like protein [Trifolium pratense]|uniref:DNA topoisomerase 6 subunit b-like protein n=1 Tax=Trifolium pratense TaxID=57577 RepID=A0A2K3MSE9_TRIPR|nr:DNA topoisomerase 6 subunit b-like protein [Trifolium pratense]